MIQVFTPNSVGIPERYLRVCDKEEVKTIMQWNKETVGRKSKDKEIVFEGKIAPSMFWNPKFRSIFFNPDPVERKRLRAKFYKDYPRLVGK